MARFDAAAERRKPWHERAEPGPDAFAPLLRPYLEEEDGTPRELTGWADVLRGVVVVVRDGAIAAVCPVERLDEIDIPPGARLVLHPEDLRAVRASTVDQRVAA